jgi:hypothetical protein
MGCGGSRVEETGVHAPLDHWMATIGVEEVDQFFSEASETIKSAEDVREIIVDRRDYLIVDSGACTYKEPTLKECFFGVCWKLSADNGGKFLDAGFKPAPDLKGLVLEGKKNSSEAMKAYKDFNDYINGLIEIEGKMTTLKTNGEKLGQTLKDKKEEMLTKVNEKFSSDPLVIPKKTKDLTGNISRVTTAVETIGKLSEEYAKSIAFLKEIGGILNQPEEISKIDEIGKKAVENKHVRAYAIVFHNITDANLREGKKPEDGYNFWSERVARKAARKANKK